MTNTPTRSSEDEPQPHWTAYHPPPKLTDRPPWVQISEHPKYWDGQLFTREELMNMSEGDFDNRLDADYYEQYERKE